MSNYMKVDIAGVYYRDERGEELKTLNYFQYTVYRNDGTRYTVTHCLGTLKAFDEDEAAGECGHFEYVMSVQFCVRTLLTLLAEDLFAAYVCIRCTPRYTYSPALQMFRLLKRTAVPIRYGLPPVFDMFGVRTVARNMGHFGIAWFANEDAHRRGEHCWFSDYNATISKEEFFDQITRSWVLREEVIKFIAQQGFCAPAYMLLDIDDVLYEKYGRPELPTMIPSVWAPALV